jgi:hypothetical protein
MTAAMGRFVLLIACASLLSGCQSCGPFRAAWYLVNKTGAEDLRMYVTLLHEDKGPATISRIVLNPADDLGLTGWKLDGTRTLSGGRLLILPAQSFKNGDKPFQGCRVPVRVAVQCKDPNGISWATVSGTMPNYLPDNWLDKCEHESE